MTINLAVIVLMTLLGSVASLMLKIASRDLRPARLLRDWHFWAGGAGYGLAAVLNIWVLRRMELSVVLPLTALTYLWTLLIARAVLGELVTWRKAFGVALIMVGVVLITTS